MVKPPAGLAWPPQLHVLTEEEMILNDMNPKLPNAFATLYKGKPWVVVNRPLLELIVKGRADRLGFILGHELSHVTLGHVRGLPQNKTRLTFTLFSKARELAADKKGIAVALAANYSLDAALKGPKQFIELGMELPPMWPSTHPTWSERLALLEKDRASLWKKVGAFNNGVYFLLFEQYGAAQRCFTSVIEEFPDSYDAHVNLGYAQLMEYCDLLTPEDVSKLDVGHLVIGGFYDRPESLIEKGRGVNKELWESAVQSLKEALRLKPDSVFAKANLGVAYLVSPGGRDLEKALPFLEAAVGGAREAPYITVLPYGAMVVNLGVAELAAGKLAQSLKRFQEAEAVASGVPFIKAAILYNRALALMKREKGAVNRQAVDSLQAYLRVSSPASTWWKLGYKNYSQLCEQAGVRCVGEQTIRDTAQATFRPLPPVEVKDGVQIQIGEAIETVKKQLGEAKVLPVASEVKLKKYVYPNLGVEVTGAESVIAIALSGAKAPPLKLQATGVGGEVTLFKVGMTEQQVTRALGKDSRVTTVFSPALRYKFYPEVGIAARFATGKVVEWIVVLVPLEEKKQEKAKS